MRILQNNITQPKIENNQNKQQRCHRQNFKGLESFVVPTMDALDRGGTFASFITQDFLGSILPRPLAGLRRNKKENGNKPNTKFAIKEMLREVITGPSMFLIPWGMIAVAKKHVGKAMDVPTDKIESLGKIFAETVNVKKPDSMKKDYYNTVFTKVLANTTGKASNDAKVVTGAQELTDALIDLKQSKSHTAFIPRLKGEILQGSVEDKHNKFIEKYIDLIKQNTTNNKIDYLSAKIDSKTSTNVGKLIEHMTNYADDVVEKTQKFAKTIKSGAELKPGAIEVKDFIGKFNNKRIGARFAFTLSMAAATVAFLAITPKIYNRSKENPGLIGLDVGQPSNQTAKTEGDKK